MKNNATYSGPAISSLTHPYLTEFKTFALVERINTCINPTRYPVAPDAESSIPLGAREIGV